MRVQEINVKDVKVIENSRLEVKDEELVGLMQTIKHHGLQNPIYVSKTKTHEYVLISGHRRLTAYQKLGYKTIPAHVAEEQDLKDLLMKNAIENSHRKDITPMELGRLCSRLSEEFDMTPKEIASRLSLPYSKIVQSFDAYKGVPEKFRGKIEFMERGEVREGKIPASVASKVLAVKKSLSLSKSQTTSLMEEVKNRDLTHEDVSAIGFMIRGGLTVSESVKNSRKYKCVRLDIFLDIEECNKVSKKNGTTILPLLRRIIYGDLKESLSRPQFVKGDKLIG